jgi:hypothetical protein
MSDATTQVLLWEILARQDALEANTRPKTGWVMASLIAIAINLFAIPYLQKHDVPYLSNGLNIALDYESALAIDLGILVADTITHTDRTAPSLPQGLEIIGLTTAEASALIESVRKTESPGYTIRNWAGYFGQWQFGAEALVTVGLVKRGNFEAAKRDGTLQGNGGWKGQGKWLENPNNWTIAGGLNTFLTTPSIQDAAFIRLCNINIQDGFRMRVLSKQTPAHKIAGWAKASHLKGTGNARKWYKYKQDSSDGNGTRTSTYALQAERAVQSINNIAQQPTKGTTQWI